MKINKLIKLKDNKYKIIFDDNIIITYDNVILENNLLYIKSIDDEIYNKIIKDTKYYDIYNKVVKYILKKKRSQKEIEIYIDKFNIVEQDKLSMVTKLKKINLINDLEYCKSFINDKVYLSKNGINKIKSDLLREDIPLELIEEELNKIDSSIFYDRLEKIILKKINSNKKYSNKLLKQKIYNEMIILGYDKNIILEILEKNLKSNEFILENEYNKIYNKLRQKYEGQALIDKVKQKLMLKGFSYEEINNLNK